MLSGRRDSTASPGHTTGLPRTTTEKCSTTSRKPSGPPPTSCAPTWIFLKYVSDTFAARQTELAARFADPADEYYLDDPDLLADELDDRDYYTAVNVFWVPEAARWEALRTSAKQPDIGKRIDDALAVIEAENARLKGILDKRYARAQLPDGKLGDVSIYGQESNPTTWRLAAMNLASRGIDFNLGREPTDTFTRNQHPDLRADFKATRSMRSWSALDRSKNDTGLVGIWQTRQKDNGSTCFGKKILACWTRLLRSSPKLLLRLCLRRYLGKLQLAGFGIPLAQWPVPSAAKSS